MAKVIRLQHTSIPMPADGHARARAFFGEALNMPEAPVPTSLDRERLVWFRAGEDGLEVHCFVDEEMARLSSALHICLQVDDIGAYRERMETHGIEVHESTAIHNRPRFFVHDPFGNLIELTEIQGDYE